MDGPLHDGRLVDRARQRRSRSERVVAWPINLDAARAPSPAGILLVPDHYDDGTWVRAGFLECDQSFEDMSHSVPPSSSTLTTPHAAAAC